MTSYWKCQYMLVSGNPTSFIACLNSIFLGKFFNDDWHSPLLATKKVYQSTVCCQKHDCDAVPENQYNIETQLHYFTKWSNATTRTLCR